MPSSQTFPNGQTLISSALSETETTNLFQQATCLCFGITNKVSRTASLELNSNQATFDSVDGVANGYSITGPNVPVKTTVVDVTGLVVTMSNNATATASVDVLITDLTAGFQVRQTWPIAGAPAWGQNDNVTFVTCTEVDNPYNKVRDEGVEANDSVSANKIIEYTRVWRVFWELRGPGAFDRARLLKTAMQLDFIHDMLSAFNLYLMPSVGNPNRVPELVEGKWWERTDFEMEFYEQVNETITVPTVASIEVVVSNSNGVQSDFEIEA